MSERRLTIRLSTKDSDLVIKALQGLGAEGEKALRRIQTATEPANRGLLALNEASKQGQGALQGYANRLGPVGSVLSSIGPAGLAAAAGIAAVGAAGGLLLKFANDAANAGDAMRDMSLRTGVSVESLSTLGFAAKQSGLDLGGLEDGLKHVSRTAAEATDPTSEQAELFKYLGVTVTDAAGKLRSADALLLDVADALKGFGSDTEKTAVALQVFGRSGNQLLPFLKEGSTGILALQQAGRDAGAEISTLNANLSDEFNDALSTAGSAALGLRNTLGFALLPTVTQLAKDFAAWATDAKTQEGIKNLGQSLSELAKFAGDAAAAGSRLFSVFSTSAASAGEGAAAAIIEAGITARKVLGVELTQMQKDFEAGNLDLQTGKRKVDVTALGDSYFQLGAALKVVGDQAQTSNKSLADFQALLEKQKKNKGQTPEDQIAARNEALQRGFAQLEIDRLRHEGKNVLAAQRENDERLRQLRVEHIQQLQKIEDAGNEHLLASTKETHRREMELALARGREALRIAEDKTPEKKSPLLFSSTVDPAAKKDFDRFQQERLDLGILENQLAAANLSSSSSAPYLAGELAARSLALGFKHSFDANAVDFETAVSGVAFSAGEAFRHRFVSVLAQSYLDLLEGDFADALTEFGEGIVFALQASIAEKLAVETVDWLVSLKDSALVDTAQAAGSALVGGFVRSVRGGLFALVRSKPVQGLIDEFESAAAPITAAGETAVDGLKGAISSGIKSFVATKPGQELTTGFDGFAALLVDVGSGAVRGMTGVLTTGVKAFVDTKPGQALVTGFDGIGSKLVDVGSGAIRGMTGALTTGAKLFADTKPGEVIVGGFSEVGGKLAEVGRTGGGALTDALGGALSTFFKATELDELRGIGAPFIRKLNESISLDSIAGTGKKMGDNLGKGIAEGLATFFVGKTLDALVGGALPDKLVLGVSLAQGFIADFQPGTGSVWSTISNGVNSALTNGLKGAAIGRLIGDEITAQAGAIGGIVGGIIGSAFGAPQVGSAIGSVFGSLADKIFFAGERKEDQGQVNELITDLQAFGGLRGFFEKIGGIKGFAGDRNYIQDKDVAAAFERILRVSGGLSKEEAGDVVHVLQQADEISADRLAPIEILSERIDGLRAALEKIGISQEEIAGLNIVPVGPTFSGRQGVDPTPDRPTLPDDFAPGGKEGTASGATPPASTVPKTEQEQTAFDRLLDSFLKGVFDAGELQRFGRDGVTTALQQLRIDPGSGIGLALRDLAAGGDPDLTPFRQLGFKVKGYRVPPGWEDVSVDTAPASKPVTPTAPIPSPTGGAFAGDPFGRGGVGATVAPPTSPSRDPFAGDPFSRGARPVEVPIAPIARDPFAGDPFGRGGTSPTTAPASPPSRDAFAGDPFGRGSRGASAPPREEGAGETLARGLLVGAVAAIIGSNLKPGGVLDANYLKANKSVIADALPYLGLETNSGLGQSIRDIASGGTPDLDPFRRVGVKLRGVRLPPTYSDLDVDARPVAPAHGDPFAGDPFGRTLPAPTPVLPPGPAPVGGFLPGAFVGRVPVSEPTSPPPRTTLPTAPTLPAGFDPNPPPAPAARPVVNPAVAYLRGNLVRGGVLDRGTLRDFGREATGDALREIGIDPGSDLGYAVRDLASGTTPDLFPFRALGVRIRGLSLPPAFADLVAAATGYRGILSRPTPLLVGEHGPERVSILPVAENKAQRSASILGRAAQPGRVLTRPAQTRPRALPAMDSIFERAVRRGVVVPKEAVRVVVPSRGFQGVVQKPTLFIVGEQGSAQVEVVPLRPVEPSRGARISLLTTERRPGSARILPIPLPPAAPLEKGSPARRLPIRGDAPGTARVLPILRPIPLEAQETPARSVPPLKRPSVPDLPEVADLLDVRPQSPALPRSLGIARLDRPDVPAGKVEVVDAGKGLEQTVRTPTLFVAGEAGRAAVEITPTPARRSTGVLEGLAEKPPSEAPESNALRPPEAGGRVLPLSAARLDEGVSSDVPNPAIPERRKKKEERPARPTSSSRRHALPPIIPAAKGFRGIVEELALFLAGEAGPERVRIAPPRSTRTPAPAPVPRPSEDEDAPAPAREVPMPASRRAAPDVAPILAPRRTPVALPRREGPALSLPIPVPGGAYRLSPPTAPLLGGIDPLSVQQGFYGRTARREPALDASREPAPLPRTLDKGVSIAARNTETGNTEVHIHIGQITTPNVQSMRQWVQGELYDLITQQLYRDSFAGKGIIAKQGVIGLK